MKLIGQAKVKDTMTHFYKGETVDFLSLEEGEYDNMYERRFERHEYERLSIPYCYVQKGTRITRIFKEEVEVL